MLAQDIMTGNVVTVGPDAKVENVAQLLLERRVSGVPVVDKAGALLGIVSEGDLMRRPESGTEPHHSWWLGLLSSGAGRAEEYLKTHGLTAGDVMTKSVITVAPETPVGDIAEILERRHIKRVPVVHGGKLVGIVSRANILRALAAHKKKLPAATAQDDKAIRAQVLEHIRDAGLENEALVDTIVNDGVVHFWGAVESEKARDALRVAAQSTDGVKSVEMNLGILTGTARAAFWAE